MKKEISSYKHFKKAFCESAFYYVYSSHIDEAFFILGKLETPSWMDPRRDIWDHIRAYRRLSVKLFCAVLIPLAQLSLSFIEQFSNPVNV